MVEHCANVNVNNTKAGIQYSTTYYGKHFVFKGFSFILSPHWISTSFCFWVFLYFMLEQFRLKLLH